MNKTAQAQLGQLDAAINAYKDAYGFYPPDATNPMINQLYYELEGTTNRRHQLCDAGRQRCQYQWTSVNHCILEWAAL